MSRSRQFNYTLLVPFVQSGNGFEIPFIGFPCLNPFFKFTSDLTQGKSGELPPVHSLQRAVPKKTRQQQRKQCNIVLPNKTSKTWHPINNNEWIFIFRAHNKTLFYPYSFFLANVAEIRANPSQGPTTCQTLSNQIFASCSEFLFFCHIAPICSQSSARVLFIKGISLCYLSISPSFSKMNPFSSALVLCLCFLAVSTAPEKNSAKSRMHDGKLSDKEHFDKDGKHNEEYDHEAFLGKEKKSFDQLTPEESKERLG